MSDIKIQTLKRLLKRVYLGGLIDECVLNEGKEGVNTIQAIDLTNSLILTVAGKTNFKGFGKLGLSDLGTICKYLETADEETEMEVDENRLIFRSKSGTFKYLLSEPDLIPTSLDDKDALNNLIENCTHEVIMKEEFQKNFMQSMALTKTNSVTVVVGENAILSGGLESEHQFSVKIGKPKIIKKDKDREDKKFRIPIYGSHLIAVLNALDWSVEENLPVMMIKPNKPIIIKQNKDSWALTIVESK